MQQNTVDAIRKWLRQCPELDKKNHFGVDNMGADPTEYAIYMSPSTLKYTTDILGKTHLDSVQERNFVFASRNNHTPDVLQNLANHGWYDSVISWMVDQNAVGNLPVIPDGEVISVMPTMTQYLFEAGASTGRYQISCKMKYRRMIL